MRRQIPALGSLLVVAAVLCILPFVLSDYNISLAAQVGIFFIAVLGLNILTGYTGQISIGHGAFMAIGGYTTAVMSRDHHTNLVVTMLMAFAICFVVGLLVGLPALRLSGVYLALVTFALAVSVPQIPLQYSSFLGGSGGVQSSQTVSNLWIYVAAWACSAILFVLAWLILRGRVGRAFRAVRDSEIAAVASGVELPVYKTLAFGISAAYAGVAGSLFVLATNGFAQPSEFAVFLSLQTPRRRGRGRARLALGGPRRRGLRGAPAPGLDERAGDRRRARPRRRLRRRGDPRHAPAPRRLRRPARAATSSRTCLNRGSISIKLHRKSSHRTPHRNRRGPSMPVNRRKLGHCSSGFSQQPRWRAQLPRRTTARLECRSTRS